MKRPVNVIVVGAGPAGCAAAITLANTGLNVDVLDFARAPKERAGETLPPSAAPVLADLGIRERFLAQNHISLFNFQSCWGSHSLSENDFSLHPYGAWHQLNRPSFDLMLSDVCLELGVNLYKGAKIKKFTREGSGIWNVVFDDDSGRQQKCANFIIDATGRAAFVSRQLGASRQKFDSLIGLVSSFSSDSANTAAEFSFLIEAVSLGWICSTQTHDKQLAVTCMTDLDIIPKNRKLLNSVYLNILSASRYSKFRVKNFMMKSPPQMVIAHTEKLNQVYGNGWLAIGDAAFSFDPLSSQGIKQALSSGILGAQAISSYLAGSRDSLEEYANQMEEVFRSYSEKCSEFYEKEKRWMTSPFWLRRHNFNQAGI